MIFARFRVTAVAMLAAFAVSMLSVHAQVWEQRCVLLTTGSVVTGTVQQQGNLLRIRQNEGNEIRIDSKQVVAIGANIHELYQHKLAKLPRHARGGDHRQLARWCLSVNLLKEAGEHYLLLTQSHPAHSNQSVKQLGVEIKDKMLQQNEFRVALGLPPIDHQNSNNNTLGNSTPPATTQSSANVITASTDLSHPSMPAIPSQLQVRFSEQTQHILINRCGQAACHGSATKTPFRLIEVGGRDAFLQTQQNLNAVSKYISDDPQAKSALIDYLTTSHANMNSPAIGPRESQLVNEVVNWVQLVQNPVVSAEAWAQPNTLNPVNPTAPQLRQVPRAPAAGPTVDVPQFPEGADVPTVAELDALDALIRQQQMPVNATRVPPNSDPFDPGEFNRQAVESK